MPKPRKQACTRLGCGIILFICIVVVQGCFFDQVEDHVDHGEPPESTSSATPQTTTRATTATWTTTTSSAATPSTSQADVAEDSTFNFFGITSAASFQEGEVEVAWDPADWGSSIPGNDSGIEQFKYFLIYDEQLDLASVYELLNESSEAEESSNATVVAMGSKLQAVLKGLEPTSTVSLLVLAVSEQGEISQNTQVTELVVAASSPKLFENVTELLHIKASDDLFVYSTASNLSIYATTGGNLPIVSEGMCLTGIDSDNLGFLVIVENVSRLGNYLVATTHSVALTDIFQSLQLDVSFDSPESANDASGRRLAGKSVNLRMSEHASFQFAAGGVSVDPYFDAHFKKWHVSFDMEEGVLKSARVSGIASWLFEVDVKYAVMTGFTADLLKLPLHEITFPNLPLPLGLHLKFIGKTTFKAKVSASIDRKMDCTLTVRQNLGVDVGFVAGRWEARYDNAGIQHTTHHRSAMHSGTVTLSAEISWSLEILLHGLFGLEIAGGPSLSLSATAAKNISNQFLIEHAPLEGAHFKDLSVKLSLHDTVSLICGEKWKKFKFLCSFLGDSDALKLFSITDHVDPSITLLALPSLHLDRVDPALGCLSASATNSADATWSIGLATEHRWLLDSGSVEIAEQGLTTVDLRRTDSTNPLLGTIYYLRFVKGFEILPLMASWDLDENTPACLGGTTTTSTTSTSNANVCRTPPFRPLLDVFLGGQGLLEKCFPAPGSPKVLGILLVRVIAASNLINSEPFGLPDPYVTVTVGQHQERTPVIQGTQNPRWVGDAPSFLFSVEEGMNLTTALVGFSVHDEDVMFDDYMGGTELEVSCANPGAAWNLDLHDTAHGQLAIEMALHCCVCDLPDGGCCDWP